MAGGAGRRVSGRDKGLIPWRNQPLIEYVLESLREQVDSVIISCNRNHEIYEGYGYPVVTDRFADYSGPLAGVEAALGIISEDTSHCFICPCDCPTLPRSIVNRFIEAMTHSSVNQAYYAHDGIREQYLFALLPIRSLSSLNAYLASGQRSVRGWYTEIDATAIDFSEQAHHFANLNTLEGMADPD